MKNIMSIELITEIIFTSLTLLGGIYSNEAMLLNVAKGHSAKMENIINPKNNGIFQQLGRWSIIAALVMAVGLMFLELACYIVIYVQVYISDEKMKASLSKKSVSYRKKRNIISLSSQVIYLCIEIIGGIIGTLIVAFQVTDASVFPIIACVGSAMISVMHVLGSLEMRDFYFRAQNM